MSEPFVGEIRMFAGNFAPRGWAFCDGQLLAVSQNDALFSLLGTIYGGDGRTTFGLPDVRGRLPIHAGTGPGLSNRTLGAKGGQESVTVTVNQLPAHSHQAKASGDVANELGPVSDNVLANTAAPIYVAGGGSATMGSGAIGNTGGSRNHTNLMPYLCIHFIIALFGIYPSRQ